MKQYWKLFIPYQGIKYAQKLDMDELSYKHPAIYFGSSIVQCLYLVSPFIIIFILAKLI